MHAAAWAGLSPRQLMSSVLDGVVPSFHNPKPVSANSTLNVHKPLSRVNLKLFLSAENKLHLVRTEDEIQETKYLLIAQLTNESD